MSAPTLHLKGHSLDPALPLSLQADSLAAEIEACQVFTQAAAHDLAAGDLRAIARLAALATHEQQLRTALFDIDAQLHVAQLP